MLSALVILAIHAADAPSSTTAPQKMPAPYSVGATAPSGNAGRRHTFAIMSLPIQRFETIGSNAEEKFRQQLEGERQAIGPDARVDRILGLPPQLVGVDANVNDRGPLDGSNRGQSVEMAAQPIAFKRIFTAPDGSGSMVRGNGALYATFPFSTYRHTKKGILIMPAPGTLYRIGMPLEWLPDTTQREPRGSEMGGRIDTAKFEQINSRIDRRIEARVGNPSASSPRIAATTAQPPQPTAAPVPSDAPLPRIASDEAYRRAFLNGLITNARKPR